MEIFSKLKNSILSLSLSLFHSPENYTEGEDLKQHGGTDGKMFLLTCHSEGCQGKGPVVEGQLERHVDSF